MFSYLLQLLATLALVYFVWPLFCILFNYSIGKFIFSGRKSLLKDSSSRWAIITGSTSGIGLEISHELANCGLNVFLLSQNEEKLKALSSELKGKYKINAKFLAVDFTKNDVYERIQKELIPLNIAILVNNVGISYDHPDYFATSDEATLIRNEALLNCNNLAMVQMSRIVLQNMKSNPCPHKRFILNVGSFGGLFPNPYLTTYAATKAFVKHFTKCLSPEVASNGIVVQAYTPYFVATAMSKIKRSSQLIPSASTYAKSCLDMLGVVTISAGYLPHELVILIVSLVPDFLITRVIAKQMLILRAKFYKRHK